jgi:hypothetical protein
MQGLLAELIGSVLEMPERFAPVFGDPLSIPLIAIGALLVAVATGALGYLTVGALLEPITSGAREPPRPPEEG